MWERERERERAAIGQVWEWDLNDDLKISFKDTVENMIVIEKDNIVIIYSRNIMPVKDIRSKWWWKWWLKDMMFQMYNRTTIEQLIISQPFVR